MKKKIFATGMGGCVGHYLFDELNKRDDVELTFLIRSPEKIKYDLSNINVIKDEFKNIKRYADIIKESDYVIHLLADWGGEEGNYHETLDMLGCIDPQRIEKIIYFSTASILGKGNIPAKEALACGTPYIRGKYKMHEALVKMPHYLKTVVLYPTWVLGGDDKHPYSHATMAIKQVSAWIRLIRLFSIDITFHFIHSADIALITANILNSDIKNGEFVLGNTAITCDEFIKAVCNELKIKNSRFKIKIPVELIRKTAAIFGKRLTDWDNYCIDNRNITYKVSNPATFGIIPEFDTAEKALKEIFKKNA
ncbi:MAG: NAD(P)-dependent oxidoreductase [Candidatus Margulisiibacteriota bacterium]